MFGKISVCVGPLCDLSSESLDLGTSFQYASASSEYLGQVHISRSFGQG